LAAILGGGCCAKRAREIEQRRRNRHGTTAKDMVRRKIARNNGLHPIRDRARLLNG
jgi:hypothetical protein